MTVEKPKPKQLFRPITTRTNSTMNQSQFLGIICHSLKAREKITRTWCDWFWFYFSLVEKLARVFLAKAQLLSTVIWKLLYHRKNKSYLQSWHFPALARLANDEGRTLQTSALLSYYGANLNPHLLTRYKIFVFTSYRRGVPQFLY